MEAFFDKNDAGVWTQDLGWWSIELVFHDFT